MTIRDGLRSMLSEGTPRAFFRGNGANVLKIAPETALKLTFNDRIKRAVSSVRSSSSSDSGSPPSSSSVSLSPGERFVAGAAAGALAQSAIYPLELIRTRLAICPKGTYRGIADAAARVLRSEGPRAFYRGLAPSLIGILPYAGVDIAAFETLKEALLDAYEPRGEPPPPAAIIAAGAASSSVAQFCSYPLALVRTRLQAQGAGGRPIKYDGMLDVIRKTVASEGVRGLYKGENEDFFFFFFFDRFLDLDLPPSEEQGRGRWRERQRQQQQRRRPRAARARAPRRRRPSLLLLLPCLTVFHSHQNLKQQQQQKQACSPTFSRWPPAPASPGSCSRRPRARWGWTGRLEGREEIDGGGGERAERRGPHEQPPPPRPSPSFN